MNKIILLVGDSGSGKDFVLSAINKYKSIEVVKRFISRSSREKEENSISSIFATPISEIKKLDYYYEGVEKDNWYGIRKLDLDKALALGKSPVVVCPNYEIYLQMLKDYAGNVVSYFIYRGYDDEELEKWRASLIARGSSLNEIEKREKKRDKYFKELYIEHFDEYSCNVILNLYDITTKEDIRLQFEGLCEKNDIDIDFIEKSKLTK